MHTLEIKLDDGSTARVFYNSDWSGDARIQWRDERGRLNETLVPGVVLLRLGYAAAHRSITNHLVSVLEQMPGEMPR